MSDDVLISRWDRSRVQAGTRRFLAQNRGHGVDLGFATKRAASRHHFVENRAEAENVAAMVDGLAPQLLWGHVCDGADHGPVLGDRGQVFDGALVFGRSLELGHTEIQNLDAPVMGQKQVLWLEIAMHNEPFMSGGKAVCDLQRVVRSLPHGDGTF